MDDLDAAVAVVYAQPPSGFVAARTALVKELKAAKRKEDATEVAALRRPTKQAWALGEAVRRAPEAAAAFFSAVAALAHPDGDLRQRTNDLRAATGALVEAAGDLDPGEATAALLAVAADPGATGALRRGRLAEVPASGGFGGLSSDPATVPDPVEADGADDADDPRTGAAPVPGDDGSRGSAGADRERQEAEARARADHLAALVTERDRAVEEEEAAARRAEAAQGAVDEAEAELARASSALAAARTAAAAASERLAAAAQEPP